MVGSIIVRSHGSSHDHTLGWVGGKGCWDRVFGDNEHNWRAEQSRSHRRRQLMIQSLSADVARPSLAMCLNVIGSLCHVGFQLFWTSPAELCVWLWHCHLLRHLTWGMKTVFIVRNGETPDTSILDPPSMPSCKDKFVNYIEDFKDSDVVQPIRISRM
ncbi:hypothetical protein TEA_014270 [Camellia sinensis var. sinensis]|uniref:Plastocyanin-like domain-containing protein n=1 Tax=Camellia sinensis var. sinensis TaxID=542762 RepID=A0A4S4D4U2_CAMSN|nr:hypothetical protein TEA_014270 [Camellia sinensis var. sinensis]